MFQPPDLSICIVNWNTADLLRGCLSSILRETWRISLELIVVDNDSRDDSASMVRREYPCVKLLANTENVGFARANNQAFAEASGRYVLVLNSDTVVLPNALDILVQFMEVHPEAGATGCKLLDSNGLVQRSCWQGFPSMQTEVIDALFLWKLFPRLPWVRNSEISVEDLENELAVDHLLGACFVVRREVIDSIGGMDDRIFLYLEETDWCYRIKSGGWQIYYLPAAKVIHIGQQSARQDPERTLPEMYRSHLRFYRNYERPSKLQELIFKLVILLASLLRIGLWTWREYSDSQHELARGMRRGYWKTIKQLPSI